MSQTETNPNTPTFNVLFFGALGIGLIGIVIGLIGATSDADLFWQAYLIGFLFWLQLALGCLAWLLLANVLDARWVYVVKRFAAAGARTIPLLAVLSIPLIIAQQEVFPWAAEGVELGDEKAIWLAPGFFAVRVILYFVVWTIFAYLLTGWSYAADRDRENYNRPRAVQFGILGIIVYFLVTSLAAFDLWMFLDYESFSSIFGWLAISQFALAALSFILMIAAFFWDDEAYSKVATPKAIGDISSLLIVSILVWGYLSLMQFIVMWSGNIPDKVNLYARRAEYDALLVSIVLFHAIAFIVLIIPGIKRLRPVLSGIAALVFLMRIVEVFWFVLPVTNPEVAFQGWEFAMLVGFGGFWVAMFMWLMFQNPLVPLNDTSLERHMESGEHERYTSDGNIRPVAG